jgi:hypothetical protein
VTDQVYALVVFQEYSWKDPPQFEKVGQEFASYPDVLICKVDGE